MSTKTPKPLCPICVIRTISSKRFGTCGCCAGYIYSHSMRLYFDPNHLEKLERKLEVAMARRDNLFPNVRALQKVRKKLKYGGGLKPVPS